LAPYKHKDKTKQREMKMSQMMKNVNPAYRMPSLDRFSLAVDEIRLKKNLEKLTLLADRYGASRAPQDLVDEIAAQRRSLEKLKLDRDR
jgi:hypothetical protein